MKTSAKLEENDIKPFDLIAGQSEHIETDRQRLLSKKDSFVTVPCPACEASNFHVEFEKNGLEYVRCADCETLFVNPRPTEHILEECYSQSAVYEYWNKYIFPATDKARREGIYLERIERILEICKKHGLKEGGTLMEVGSGFGSFCDELNKTGYFKRIVAIEPTQDVAQSCRGLGLEVIEKPIEKVSADEINPDIIVSFEVVEHLFSPKDFYTNCSKLLNPGGLVVTTCPNIKGFDNLVMGKLSSSIDHEHLNYFHPDSLALLLSRCGFEVIEKLTPGKLDAQLVRNRGVLKGILSLDNQPFLKHVLIDKWEELGGKFQEFLADNLLSGHMWIVGKKK